MPIAIACGVAAGIAAFIWTKAGTRPWLVVAALALVAGVASVVADRVVVACLGNPDPVDMKVYCPTGKETFDDEKTEEAPSRGDRCEAA
jgi:hypothetical protein